MARIFIDLGLPSGTLWEQYGDPYRYPFPIARKLYKKELPTLEQAEELFKFCKYDIIVI